MTTKLFTDLNILIEAENSKLMSDVVTSSPWALITCRKPSPSPYVAVVWATNPYPSCVVA